MGIICQHNQMPFSTKLFENSKNTDEKDGQTHCWIKKSILENIYGKRWQVNERGFILFWQQSKILKEKKKASSDKWPIGFTKISVNDTLTPL